MKRESADYIQQINRNPILGERSPRDKKKPFDYNPPEPSQSLPDKYSHWDNSDNNDGLVSIFVTMRVHLYFTIYVLYWYIVGSAS